MDRIDELMRPPAAVSAILIVSPRDLRRDVTSSRIRRMALGGKSVTDDVAMLRCACCNCSFFVFTRVSTGLLVIEQQTASVRVRWRIG